MPSAGFYSGHRTLLGTLTTEAILGGLAGIDGTEHSEAQGWIPSLSNPRTLDPPPS